jgi:outer membrane protein OmpA-like peptidoglycan-associated protein
VAWLVLHSISKARLVAAGLGDTKPIADNATADGKAKNRRVELVKQ